MLIFIYKSVDNPSTLHHIVFNCALLWCVRLCAFVGYRVIVRGSDWRFDKLITERAYNLFGWTSGGTWCFFNGFCLWLLADCVASASNDLSTVHYVGMAVFAFGLLVESTSDIQKYRFNQAFKSDQNSNWIDTGLWAYSR